MCGTVELCCCETKQIILCATNLHIHITYVQPLLSLKKILYMLPVRALSGYPTQTTMLVNVNR